MTIDGHFERIDQRPPVARIGEELRVVGEARGRRRRRARSRLTTAMTMNGSDEE